MKVKLLLFAVLVFTITVIGVKATTFTNYLPGGINYLDENNLATTSSSISTINSFRVKENTFYTFSMPGFDMISNVSLTIEGNEVYIDGLVENEAKCTVEYQKTWCTFQTTSGDEFINVYISSSDIVYYLNSYGFQGIQLEEGTVPTDYEPYIIPLVDTTDPEFLGSGAYIKSYDYYESIENIISDHIVVVDEIDGDISENILIISDEYTFNEQIVGDYLVELSASDSSGNISYFNLTIIVKDEIDPVILGENEINLDISVNTNIYDIIDNNYSIYDDYGNTMIIIVEDNYTLNKDILGTYFVSFEVYDDYGNQANQYFNLNLIDIDAPVISSNLVIESLLSAPINLSDFLDNLIITDNYDSSDLLELVILSNQYSGNELVPGTYTINFSVGDSSGNIVVNNIIITVIDDVNPMIIGPVNYAGSYTEILTLSDFLEMMSVSDNVGILDLDDVYVISDSYTGRTETIGNFEIIFGIKDSSNNESIHTLSINIFDDIAPLIYIDEYIITVNLSSTFTENDALKLLINSKELLAGNYTIRTLIDEYSGNELNLGTYVYKLEFTNEDGVSFEKEFIVKVIDEEVSEFDESLLVRNIVIYSSVIIFLGYGALKYKK